MSRAYAEQKAKTPNAKKDTILKAISPTYGPGRTKQSFKDSVDINKIMDRARKTGTISHVGKYGAEYGDFSDIPDLLTAETRLIRAKQIFDDAPAEVRREFDNDVGAFFEYVNDPANADDVQEKLVNVARRGDQMPVVRSGAARAAEPVSAPETAEAPIIEGGPSEGTPEA